MGTITGSRRAVVGAGALVGVLLCAGTAAATTVDRRSEPDHVLGTPVSEPPKPARAAVAAAPPPAAPAAVLSTTAEAAATTAKPAATTTTAKPTSPATTKPATRAATRPATPPTTRAPVITTIPKAPPAASSPKSLSIVPVSGPSLTTIRVTGGGCTGSNAGVALTFVNPQGQPFGGDGTSAAPDGSWQLSISLGANLAPGPYTIQAACQNGSTLHPSYGSTVFTVTP